MSSKLLILLGLFFIGSIPLNYWATNKILKDHSEYKPNHNNMTTRARLKAVFATYTISLIPALLHLMFILDHLTNSVETIYLVICKLTIYFIQFV